MAYYSQEKTHKKSALPLFFRFILTVALTSILLMSITLLSFVMVFPDILGRLSNKPKALYLLSAMCITTYIVSYLITAASFSVAPKMLCPLTTIICCICCCSIVIRDWGEEKVLLLLIIVLTGVSSFLGVYRRNFKVETNQKG